MNIRPIKYEERKFTYASSSQIQAQTGSIGRLRGDFDSDGYGFFTSWEDHLKHLKTPEFQNDLDEVINTLRSDEFGLLQNRMRMGRYVHSRTDSAFQGAYTTEYGFRADTKDYSYLLRCNLTKGDYNFYCYCYRREYLNRYMEHARQDIRFIDPNYNELFRLPDGEQIVITSPDGTKLERSCRYVDEYHVEIGDHLFHICEFAEKMEQSGNTVQPKEPPLPPKCFALLPSTGEMILIERYEKGYKPAWGMVKLRTPAEAAEAGNKRLNVSKAQVSAMLAGSMFGWDCPAANPKYYDENGKAIRPKDRER